MYFDGDCDICKCSQRRILDDEYPVVANEASVKIEELRARWLLEVESGYRAVVWLILAHATVGAASMSATTHISLVHHQHLIHAPSLLECPSEGKCLRTFKDESSKSSAQRASNCTVQRYGMMS